MTTRDFIARTYNTTSTRERRCSSVFTDHDGQVYSYGYHYPLAFNLGGLDFINNQGYSNTTSKHINWAWQAVGYDAIPVKLWREDAQVISSSYSSTDEKLDAVERALLREIKSLVEQMDAKKRKNTRIYQYLSDLHEKATDSLVRVQEWRGKL